MPFFAGFKRLYDVLFVAGTFAFGLGAPVVFAGAMQAEPSPLPRALSWPGIVAGLAGLVAALLYFAHANLAPIMGLAILVGALILAVYGIQISRSGSARHNLREQASDTK